MPGFQADDDSRSAVSPTSLPGSTHERFARGAADAYKFFTYMADFVEFGAADIEAIRESRFIVEKYLPELIGDFYARLLRFPTTRKPFTKKDGTLDLDYIQMRMQHQYNFWRRTAAGVFDEEYARFVDYVGRAHTSHGADPTVYIPERYVMGMIGFVQERITIALATELRQLDPDLEQRATRGWHRLLILLLELFSRPYNPEERDQLQAPQAVDAQSVFSLSIDAYERALGIARSIETRTYFVAREEEIPEGERKIFLADDISIGVFHHKGQWVALQNSCLHRSGPVCTGSLQGDTLTCPLHGYQYNLPDGKLLLDPSAALTSYQVRLLDGEIFVTIPYLVRDEVSMTLDISPVQPSISPAEPTLARNEFLVDTLTPGQFMLVFVDGKAVTVYNVEGRFYATQDECTHAEGPLSEGTLQGSTILCPWHGSCFNVTNGHVTCGPADEPLKTYQVIIDEKIGRVK